MAPAGGGGAPVTNISKVYSIQTVYTLYLDPNTARKTRFIDYTLRCRNDIKIPVCEPVTRVLGPDRYDIIPATALVFENYIAGNMLSRLKFLIETNEGVTLEPIIVEEPFTVYEVAYLLVLPRGTTGVKNVHITIEGDDIDVPNDLRFSVMEAPYNYENYLFTLITNKLTALATQMRNKVNSLDSKIASLESRVSALENKAGT